MTIDNNKRLKRRKLANRHHIKQSALPRLSIHRTNKYIYAQIIDDAAGKTVAYATNRGAKDKQTKTESAKAVGLSIAEQAKKVKVKAVVFDRGAYQYHGRVKAVAEGAREGGLQL